MSLKDSISVSHRELDLLETVDVASSILEELDNFVNLKVEDVEQISFWQENVVKVEKLIKYQPLYQRLKKAKLKLEQLSKE